MFPINAADYIAENKGAAMELVLIIQQLELQATISDVLIPSGFQDLPVRVGMSQTVLDTHMLRFTLCLDLCVLERKKKRMRCI